MDRPALGSPPAKVALAAALALVLTAAACEPKPAATGRDTARTAPPAPARAVRQPEQVGESRPPVLRAATVTLPAGCKLTDHTDALATFTRLERGGSSRDTLGVVDLRSGRWRTVLSQPVNAKAGWTAFRPAVSAGWLAWEEVSPGEGMRPRDAAWQLLAAPLDAASLSIGPPSVIASGSTDARLRPHYALVGSTLYWTENDVRSVKRERLADGARLVAHDLAGVSRRTVFETPRRLTVLRAAAGMLVVTEDGGSATSPARFHLVDGSTGAETSAGTLPVPSAALSHAPLVLGGRLMWAAFTADDDSWPDLFVRGPEGRTRRVGIESLDPVGADGLVLFESVMSTTTLGGVRRPVYQVNGLDVARMRRFTVLSSEASQGGWWQTVTGGDARHTVVLSNDLGTWAEDAGGAHTLVRVYDTRGWR